jgi:alpha-glucosidase
LNACSEEPEVEGDEAGECTDGVDNDQDGPTDCDDPGCATATACTGDDDDSAGDDDDDSAGDDDDSAAQPSPCSFEGLVDLPSSSLPATLNLGSFEVVASTDDLIVRHTDESARDLFKSPSNGSWLHLARAVLHAEEHQGSFALEEEVFTRCESATIQAAHLQRGSLLLTGGFTDANPECAAATWTAQVCETGAHRLSMEIASDDPSFDLITLRTDSDPSEYIWGAGEQFPHNSLNLNGREIPIISQEGGLGRGHLVITPSVNAFSEGSGGTEDSTYYAAAHYITSRNQSLFLENTETAFFDFTDDSAIELRLHASTMNAQVVHGTNPLELIQRFTDWSGRMVGPPAWANEGAVVALARPLEDSLNYVDELLADGAALSAVWNQTWSGTATTFIGEQVLWNWVLNESAHPGWHDWVDALDQRGLRVLCYINTMFRELPEDVGPVSRDLFTEGLAANHFVRDEEGEVLMLPVTAFDVALLDLANEEARAWMKSIIQEEMLEGAGCSGWMADFAEALPFEAVMSDGLSGDVWHNRYPVEWAELNREALDEVGRLDDVLVFNRSGHTATPGAALTLWQGDQLVSWDRYDGLVSAIHGLISGGFSGISINHSDIGGYTSMAWLQLGYTREEELLQRWSEFAAFTSLMRTHEGNQPSLNAQIYSDEETRAHFARMTRIYRALSFYRQELFVEAATLGWPVVRHLTMHWPEESELYDISDQFLLGSELLVAPIKNKCFTWPICPYNKEVTLPPGEWVHLWTGELYGDSEAVSQVTVSAPLGEPAVFYPVGSTVGALLVENLLADGIEAARP